MFHTHIIWAPLVLPMSIFFVLTPGFGGTQQNDTWMDSSNIAGSSLDSVEAKLWFVCKRESFILAPFP